MRFEELKNIFSSWNPRSYRKQIIVKEKVLCRRLLFGILLSLAIMLIVSLPLLIQLPKNIEEKMSAFDNLNISVQFSTNNKLELSKIPLIIVDSTKENISREKVLVNSQEIIINKHLGRDDKVYSWTSLHSAKDIVNNYSNVIQVIVLLLMPSLLIALLIASFFQAIILLCLSVLIAKSITFFSRKHISFSAVIKVATLGLIPFFMIQLIPFMYIRWWSVPLFAYVLLMISAIYFVSESKEDVRQKGRSKKKKSKKYKQDVVFSEDKPKKSNKEDSKDSSVEFNF